MKYFIFLSLLFSISNYSAQAGLIHAYFKLQSILESEAKEEQKKIDLHIKRKTQKIFLNHSPSPLERVYRDSVIKDYLTTTSKTFSKNIVFLALGNDERPLTIQEKAQIAQLVNYLECNNFYIAYDFDSNAAEVIENFVSVSNRIAITGTYNSQLIHGFTIENPYFRMRQILRFKRIIVSPHSLLGLGLLLEGPRELDQLLVFDTQKKWRSDFSTFFSHSLRTTFQEDGNSKHFSENQDQINQSHSFGREIFNFLRQKINFEIFKLQDKPTELIEQNSIAFSSVHIPQVFHDKEELVHWLIHHKIDNQPAHKKPVLGPSISEILTATSGNQLLTSYKNAKSLINLSVELTHYLKFDPDTDHDPFEATVFISSQEDHSLDPIVEECIHVITHYKAPVIIKKSANSLKIAQQFATTKSVQSVTIPDLNDFENHKGILEKLGSSQFPTRTLVTSNFQEEIALLLQRRALILVTPGGSETIKQLAILFVHGSSIQSFPTIVFIGKSDYGEWLSGIKTLNLPTKFKSNLFLIDSAKELTDLLNEV